MLVHNLIVITSNRSSLIADQEFQELLTLARKLDKRPIVVLGPDGDDLLRLGSDLLDDCEIVFDPNFHGDGVFSGLKAGLQACEGAVFMIELGQSPMNPAAWRALSQKLFQHQGREHVLYPVTQANSKRIVPTVITPSGAKYFLELPADTAWPPPGAIAADFIVPALDESPSGRSLASP